MMMERHKKKKIKKYIEQDRYDKLKRFIRKEKVHIDEIVNSRGQKMVHIAAKEGAADCLEHLLTNGAKSNLVDKKGNLALHFAIDYCLENYSRHLEKDLVGSLLTFASNQQLNQRNNKGFTPRELLINLRKVSQRKSNNDQQMLVSKDEDRSDNLTYRTQEEDWSAKLAWEDDQEYQSNQGRWEEHEMEFGEQAETVDQWADRIYKAFENRGKRSKPSKPEPVKRSNCKSLAPEKDIKQAEINFMLLKEKQARQQEYQKCVQIFQETERVIGVDDMPFNGNFEGENIVEIILEGNAITASSTLKNRIREEIRRWHPDKFKQKLGSRIKKDEVDVVMEIVKKVSQALNSYGK